MIHQLFHLPYISSGSTPSSRGESRNFLPQCICRQPWQVLYTCLYRASKLPLRQHHRHRSLCQSLLADTFPFDKTEPILSSGFRIPTRDKSIVLARRLLARSRTGVLSTNFPSNITSPYVPHVVASTPIDLPDYIASCEEPSGNPTLIALTISTSARNVFAGSNVSLALSWWDEYVKLTHSEP